MWLTGRADGAALGPPAPLVPRLQAVAHEIAEVSAALGRRVEVDPLARLAERAALVGLRRQGLVSCGGGTRLVRAADGWFAVSLARPDDVDLVPTWLGVGSCPADEVWSIVEAAVAQRPVECLVEQGVLLGMAIGALPALPPAEAPVVRTRLGDASPKPIDEALVVDLSSLWAGPLCGRLLAEAGANVVKVESTTRPDGSRGGQPVFFDLLNSGKRSVAFDFASSSGRALLAALLRRADVVIEASRPRALQQLGIDVHQLAPRVWVSITGHGRRPPDGNRVGFGDDTAVAGGLVAWDAAGPCFCADAIADPASGLVATSAVLAAFAEGGRWLLDVSMRAVAADLAGETLDSGDLVARAPRPPAPVGTAPPLGHDTESVLAGLGLVS
jgi:hypothetical protein